MEDIYLSTDTTLDGGDTLLGSSHNHSTDLPPGGTHSDAEVLTIPAGTPAGGYFLLVVGDAGGTVAESNESNNLSNVPITVNNDACVAPMTLELMDDTILTTETFEACDTIFVGSNFAIVGQGNVTLRAGVSVVFRADVSVDTAARLQIIIELPTP